LLKIYPGIKNLINWKKDKFRAAFYTQLFKKHCKLEEKFVKIDNPFNIFKEAC
jgi:hypothetical protein